MRPDAPVHAGSSRLASRLQSPSECVCWVQARMAQLRYRERRRQANETLEQQIAVLSHQVQEMQPITQAEQYQQQLQARNEALQVCPNAQVTLHMCWQPCSRLRLRIALQASLAAAQQEIDRAAEFPSAASGERCNQHYNTARTHGAGIQHCPASATATATGHRVTYSFLHCSCRKRQSGSNQHGPSAVAPAAQPARP